MRDPSTERFEEFLARAKRRRHSRLAANDWLANKWVVECRTNPGTRRSFAVLFRGLPNGSGESVDFPEPFASFAKAICNEVARNVGGTSFKPFQNAIYALRYLLAALPGPDCAPSTFLKGHFQQAALAMAAAMPQQTAAQYAASLARIGKYVDLHGLTPRPLEWVSPLHQSIESGYSAERVVEHRARKLLSNEDLGIWAERSAEPGSDHERLCQRFLDMMLCGGLRACEVRSLPVDAWYEARVPDPDGGWKTAQALRYYPAKDTGKVPFLKVIPPFLAPVAKRAYLEVVEITKDARHVANRLRTERWPFPPVETFTWYDDNNKKVHEEDKNDWHDEDVWLDDRAAAPFLRASEYSRRAVVAFLKRHSIPFTVEGREDVYGLQYGSIWGPMPKVPGKGRIVFRKYPFLKAVLSTYATGFHVEGRHGEVHLDKLLFVMRDGAGLDSPGSPYLVGPMTDHAIAEYLKRYWPRRKGAGAGRGTDGRGLNEWVTPQMFRTFMGTMALQGGLDDMSLANWMGRTSLGSNKAYDLRQPSSKVERARSSIEQMSGSPTADPVEILARQFADPIDETLGHATAVGRCGADPAFGPCERLVAGLQDGSYAAALDWLTREDLVELSQDLDALIVGARREAEDDVTEASDFERVAVKSQSIVASKIKVGVEEHA